MEATIVSNKDLKAVQKRLKKFKGFYIDKLVIRMNKHKVMRGRKTFNETTVYNIFNGVIKNQLIRGLFYTEALAVADELEDLIKKEVE